MMNYSKLLGSLVGGVLGIGVSKFGLPSEMASPDIVASIVTVLSALATFLAPANRKG
jgi:hypothetical protein